MKKRNALLLLSCLAGLFGRADIVHVFEQTKADGQAVQISDRSLITGMPWTTQMAPVKSGYIFTHWTISTKQDFESRDEWGRASDVATFMLYEDTTLTAHYLPAAQDEDGDGVADGHEIYWYGNLNQGPTSDTDGDGFAFAEELANGTNPVMPDDDDEGPVRYVDGSLLQYNPLNMPSCIFRSEPEGVLFATKSDIVRAGTYETSEDIGSFSSGTAKFAYWLVNGVAQRDEWGRTIDVIAFNMPTVKVEVVAVTANDEETRQKLYWYGRTDVSMGSDTDCDGMTFAEELATGLNPLMPDDDDEGPVRYTDGQLLRYNPWNMHSYTIRSEPEGALCATVTEYVKAGLMVEPVNYSSGTSTFAYWKMNGVALRDEFGRAMDSGAFQMPTTTVELVAVSVDDANDRQKIYWYGTTEISMESDTDGDGFTFAEELANGTNPLMYDDEDEGPVRYADSELHEANLQPFEQAEGAIVDGEYQSLFYSPIADNEGCSDFGTEAVPNIVDVNGDGLFDLVVVSQAGHVVFVNTGTVGNPQFERRTDITTNGLALVKGGLERLDGLVVDVQPTDAVSCTFGDVDQDGNEDLLVSDAQGRVWYYHNGDGTFYLRHKVWAGSYPGFADKLYLAAVDWDDDGDLDCVCGTAEGRLMLLVDPRIGRPMNVRAYPGVDSVVIEWDASVNSMVRGYGVYRGVTSNDYTRVQQLWPLPTYRDVPEVLQDYYYRVTSMGRHYISGNSVPIVSESMPTDAVYVQFRPSVWLNDTSSFTDTNVEVIVSMNNSMGISTDGFSMTFAYDPEVLTPVEMKTTGLTEGMAFGEVKVKGEGKRWNWQISATGGEIGTGSGRFLRLVFYVKPVHDVTETTVSITAATVKAGDGRAVTLDLPKSAKIEISDSHPIVPAIVSVNVADAAVETESEFGLPVTITSTETLTNFVADVAFDETLLEFRGCDGGAARPESAPYRVETTGGDFVLKFYAKDPECVMTNLSTVVAMTNVVATDCHGFVVNAADASGTVLLKNVHPWVPATVSLSTVDRKVDTMTEFEVPVKVMSSVALVNGWFTIDWDEEVLELQGVDGETARPESAPYQVETQGGDFKLKFYAKDQHDVTKTQVSVMSAQVKDMHGFMIAPEVPVVSTVLIHDAHPLIPAKVSLSLGSVTAKTEAEFEMALDVTTTEALTALKLSIDYDDSLLELRSGALEYSGSVPSRVVLRFFAMENHEVKSTDVTVTPVLGTDHNGLAAEFAGATVGKVVFEDSNPWQPATVGVNVGSVKVDTLVEFELPVTITSNQTLTEFAATVEWDEDVLEWRGVEGATLRRAGDNAPYQVVGNGGNFKLKFYAKNQHATTKTNVRLVNMSAVDVHGLAANEIVNALGVVLIHDSQPLVPAGVAMNVSKVYADTLSTFSLPIVITSTKTLTNLTVDVGWDANLIEFKGVANGLMNGNTLTVSGTVPSVIYLTFYAKDQHHANQTTVTLGNASALCIDGLNAKITTVNGTVYLTDSNVPEPVTMTVATWHSKVKSGESFKVRIGATTSGDLATLTVDVDWDDSQLTFNGCPSAKSVTVLSANSRRFVFDCTGNYNVFNLDFTAPTISGLQASSWTRVVAASGVGRNGLAAIVQTELPRTGNVMIVREVGRYDPGDIDGDGAYTANDLLILNGYVVYLKMAAKGAAFGDSYASAYQKQYGVNVKLSGSAARAADVNCDGVVTSSDIAMLDMLIKEAEGVGK